MGDVVCYTDVYAENTITKISVDDGLLGGGINGNISIGVNTSNTVTSNGLNKRLDWIVFDQSAG